MLLSILIICLITDMLIINYTIYFIQIITFCNQTTAHGMSHIGKEEAAQWYKMVWIAIIVGALLGNTLHLYFIVTAYLKYPSQEISELSPDLPRFPDVTVCNVNPINQMKAENISRDNSSSLVRFTSLLTSMASEIAELNNITGVCYLNKIVIMENCKLNADGKCPV